MDEVRTSNWAHDVADFSKPVLESLGAYGEIMVSRFTEKSYELIKSYMESSIGASYIDSAWAALYVLAASVKLMRDKLEELDEEQKLSVEDC